MGIRRAEFHLQKPRSESTVVRCISPVKAGFRGRALLAFQKNLTMTLEHTVSALGQLAPTNQSLKPRDQRLVKRTVPTPQTLKHLFS